MNSIKTLYKLMEVSSRDLEIPDAYQRKLNTERVAKIVAGFNERIANEPKVSFRDGHYYVFDGQHTIVARKHMNGNNALPILCKVYYGMTEAEEALLFAMQTGYSAALTPSARLRANLRGEDKASGVGRVLCRHRGSGAACGLCEAAARVASSASIPPLRSSSASAQSFTRKRSPSCWKPGAAIPIPSEPR